MTDTNTNGAAALKEPAPLAVVMEKVKFGFKKADPLTGIKRAPVELEIPVPTLQGLVDFLQADDPKIAEKNQKFILSLLANEVKEAARQQVASDEKPVNTQDELDISMLDLTYIANLPPSERSAAGTPKEVWDAFGTKYNEVMPAATGKSAEQIANAALLLTKKLLPCKTNKKALTTLNDQLQVFWNTINDDDKEEFESIYGFLNGKIETYLKTDESALIANNL